MMEYSYQIISMIASIITSIYWIRVSEIKGWGFWKYLGACILTGIVCILTTTIIYDYNGWTIHKICCIK